MEGIFKEITENLQNINTKYVILFGSYAKRTQNEDSDIDLVVVLDSEEISQTYEQKMERKVLVRNCIYEQSRKWAIDLVVYTNAEFDLIRKNNTSFYNEIVETGKVLYEKAG